MHDDHGQGSVRGVQQEARGLARRLTVADVIRETGLSRRRAARLATNYSWLSHPQGDPPTYDPTFLDMLAALRCEPHRTVEPAHRDWLELYIDKE